MKLSIFVLSILGLVIVFSLMPSLFWQQIVYLSLGWLIFFLFSRVDYRIFEKLTWIVYMASLIFLTTPFIFGTITRGALRWLEIGPFRLQPSELIKPFLIVFFAHSFSAEEKPKMKKIIGSLLLLAGPLILVFIQPDLGSCILIFLAWAGILFESGVNLGIILAGIISGLISLPLVWKFFLKVYQRQRIFSFIKPWSDPLGAGYHLIQARVAIGTGQLFGRGLGQGTQSHLRFLPERQTDFVFASLAEDLGFLGVSLLIFTYGFLMFRILKTSQLTEDRFGRLICIGVFNLLFFQVFINLGMCLGLMPITGVTLPLVSYGGSSFLSTMIALGMVANIASLNKKRGKDIISIH